jgi:hypothetical protein
MLASIAAAGFVAVVAMPAQAGQSALPNGVLSTAQSEHTDISAQRRYHRHRYYAPRYRYAPRYGYYRPYRYARPYGYYRPYYSPGVSFGFWGGPRLGVWF